MNEPNKKEQQIKKIIIEVINKKGGSLKREDIYSDIEQQVNASKLTETYKSIESYRSTVRSCISKLKEEGYLKQFNFLEITLKGRELLSASAFKLETEPSFQKIYQDIRFKGLRIDERTLRRYHLALKTRKFVILSGISGTGKTWLTKAYADAIDAEHLPVPVAPNWTTNEDLLGYLNPITDKAYHHTDFSRFLEKAETEYKQAQEEQRTPKPYHLVLDEMNLARVEYYFAKFLSAMEVRMRGEVAQIELAPDRQVLLPPNLYFIGTVNMDETTHGFADKVYDRAQLIELEVARKDLDEHLGEVPYREILMNIWDSVHAVAPFAFRVLDEIKAYVEEAEKLKEAESSERLDDVREEALDEQLLQKILPKLKGADDRVGVALKAFLDIVNDKDFPLSHKKATNMLDTFNQHGFTSYF
ncbi:MAG TPA: AAA family ATPase [Coleofasciculaceae cyanobacterium]|jgi:MoxR-like ATPase